jgi:phosphonatase-like hydrolase
LKENGTEEYNMNTKTKLVVFDIAGTTVRDEGNVTTAFVGAFADNGIEINKDKVFAVMGYRKLDAIRTLMDETQIPASVDRQELEERIHDSFIRRMIRHYSEHPTLTPMPFAAELFAHLRDYGIRVALNTGFTKAITDTIVSRLGWNGNDNIDVIISSDEVNNGRPHPDMIKTIMERLNIPDAASVVKVGDTEVDILEGRNAGCGLVVSVTTGAYKKDQLAAFHPDHIINDLSELPSLLHLN